MIRIWDWLGNLLLGSTGRASRIDQDSMATERAPLADGWESGTEGGLVPQIRPAFSVIEGGRRGDPQPTQPQTPKRRAS